MARPHSGTSFSLPALRVHRTRPPGLLEYHAFPASGLYILILPPETSLFCIQHQTLAPPSQSGSGPRLPFPSWRSSCFPSVLCGSLYHHHQTACHLPYHLMDVSCLFHLSVLACECSLPLLYLQWGTWSLGDASKRDLLVCCCSAEWLIFCEHRGSQGSRPPLLSPSQAAFKYHV